jgi:hypothetical protein
MNQVFNINRWLLFTSKHWNENKKKYLLSLVAIAALLTIWFFIVLLVEPGSAPYPYPMQSTTYFIGLFVIGLLYASLMFADLADSPKGIHFLLIPASAFEKLLTTFLFSTILFFICYTLIFYGVDVVMIKIANSLEYNYNAAQPYEQKVVNVFGDQLPDHDFETFSLFFLLYAALQAAFLLGSVYFERYSFIKTAICLLVVFLFFMLLIVQVLGGMMPEGSWPTSLVKYNIKAKDVVQVVALPRWIGDVMQYVFVYALAPFFLLVTYFRLKEKEV